jgi:hypothetical protein
MLLLLIQALLDVSLVLPVRPHLGTHGGRFGLARKEGGRREGGSDGMGGGIERADGTGGRRGVTIGKCEE